MRAAVDCTDLGALAKYLGFAPQRLYLLSKKSNDMYCEVYLPKRADPSRERKIDIPTKELKGVQRSILRAVLQSVEVSPYTFSYVAGRSVTDVARKLAGRKNVLRVDIEDFFPSISRKRVYGLFAAIGFNNEVCTVLAALTTYKGYLPQGAPTSPCITNLICRRMDQQMNALAQAWRIQYIRYSDDIFFTSSDYFNAHKILAKVRNILSDHGFMANAQKCKYYFRGRPRLTLGLLTHGRSPQIPRRVRRGYRAAFHRASKNPHWARENLEKLGGMAGYYKAVYGSDEVYNHYKSILDTARRLRLHLPYKT